MRLPAIARALLPLTLLACDSDGVLAPPLGFSKAVASATCGPTDGPAVAVLLAPSELTSASPTVPHLRLHVWRATPDLVGTWSLARASAQGFAARVGPAGDVTAVATNGTIIVRSVREDTTIVGSVDVWFPSGERIRGGFRARWITTTRRCG